MSDVSWTVERQSRHTEVVYAISGAEPMRLYGRLAQPEWVTLRWYDGELPSGWLVSGHVIKADGTPGRAVAQAHIYPEDAPAWLTELVASAVEAKP